MNTLSVIIARAGSKGLPNKAMQSLMGKPLIVYTIEHALASKRVDQVILSSDSQDILAIGESFGLPCFKRPPHLASDAATIDAGVRHGVESFEQQIGKPVRYIAIHYGNIPIRPADLTDRALIKLIETEADSVQSVYPVGKMHPLWMKKLAGPCNDVLDMYEHNTIYRRQDLPPCYMLDGGVLAMTRESLFSVDPAQPHAFLGRDRRAIVCPAGAVADVDTPMDLILAEVLLRHQAASHD